MMAIGKKVPDKNIMGKVIMFPTILAVSGVFDTVPTSMPKEQKSSGPSTRNGISHSVNVMFAPNTKMPTPAISRKETDERTM